MWVALREAEFSPDYRWTSDDAKAFLGALTCGHGSVVSFGGLLVRIIEADRDRIVELLSGPFGRVYQRLMVQLHNANLPSRYPLPRGAK